MQDWGWEGQSALGHADMVVTLFAAELPKLQKLHKLLMCRRLGATSMYVSTYQRMGRANVRPSNLRERVHSICV